MKRRIYSVALLSMALMTALGLALLAAPGLALAAEESEEGGLGIGLLLPKLGELIPMLVAFVILFLILSKTAWPVFMGMLDKRAENIKNDMEQAELAKQESERLLNEHQAALELARQEAAEIIAQARESAEQSGAEIMANAQAEAEAILARALAAIENEKKSALAELQASAADMTIMVAKRVVGTDLSSAEHRSIIERYLAEAGNFNEN